MLTFTNQALILGTFGGAVLGWMMFLLSVFLILLILVQRGKGGGLTGALGGPGGQSAFGSKAGDTFTLITAVAAIIWGLVCAIAMYTLGIPPLADDEDFKFDDTPALTAPADEAATGSTSGGAGGLSGIGDALNEGTASEQAATDAADADADSGTPSLELTPAETTPAETTPADSPEAETPAPEASESESE